MPNTHYNLWLFKNEVKIIYFSVCFFQAGTKSLVYQYLYIFSCLDLTIL